MLRLADIKPWLRHTPKLVGVAALAFIIYWMAVGFRSKVGPGEAEEHRAVASSRPIVEVRRLQTTQTVSAVGTVEPRRKAEVASRLLATVLEVKVDAGDRVTAGQTLVVLDDREIQAQLREAEASVAGVAANLAVRDGDYQRYKAMFAENAVTKEDFDRVEGAYTVVPPHDVVLARFRGVASGECEWQVGVTGGKWKRTVSIVFHLPLALATCH